MMVGNIFGAWLLLGKDGLPLNGSKSQLSCPRGARVPFIWCSASCSYSLPARAVIRWSGYPVQPLDLDENNNCSSNFPL